MKPKDHTRGFGGIKKYMFMKQGFKIMFSNEKMMAFNQVLLYMCFKMIYRWKKLGGKNE